MLTVDLTDGEIAMFAPFEGAKLRGSPGRKFDLFIRMPGQTGWHYGVTCENANMAMACQNYLMRTYGKPIPDNDSIMVKMLSK